MKKFYTVEFDMNWPSVYENVEAESEDEAIEKAMESMEFDMHEILRHDNDLEARFVSRPSITEQEGEL